MKNHFSIRVIVLIVPMLVSATSGMANNQFVSDHMYKVLMRLEGYIDEEKYDQALSKLSVTINGRKALTAYEKALLDQISGVIYSHQSDYAKAEKHFNLSIQSGELPDNLAQQVHYNLVQIYLLQEQYERAIYIIKNELLSLMQEVSPHLHFMLANAYLGLNDLPQALVWSEKSLEKASEQTPENYYALAINLYLNLQQYRKAAPLLQHVLQYSPDKSIYWRQLAAVHIELGNEAQALATAELGYVQGALREERDLLKLAKLYINLGLPYKASQLLESGLQQEIIKADAKAYELLAAAWNNAREYQRAIEPLTKAAELSKQGDLSLRLSQVYMAKEEWKQALVAIEHSLAKGGGAKKHKVRLNQAIIYTQLGQHETAEEIFMECLNFKDIRQQAIEWLKFLGREVG